jgi:hypothetical protein
MLFSFQGWRTILAWTYVAGFLLMLTFNYNCYPGTQVGKVGWAITWPLSMPAFINEFWISADPNDMEIWNRGCFLRDKTNPITRLIEDTSPGLNRDR